jgi:aminoglycoside 2'-N-acetyltransferase I
MTSREDAAPLASVRRLLSGELRPAETQAIRRILWAAFPEGEEGFTEEDWQHGLGGVHFVLDVDGRIVGHASVVERELHVGDHPLRTGYVEAVAVEPARQGMGLGTVLMRHVTDDVSARFELGALGTGSHRFYERLGWRTWAGPSSVRTADGTHPTPGEDGFILVLPTPLSPPLDFSAPISCDWRPGDVW